MDPAHLESLWTICEPGLVPPDAATTDRERTRAAFFAGMVSTLMLLHRIREQGDNDLDEFLHTIAREFPAQPASRDQDTATV